MAFFRAWVDMVGLLLIKVKGWGMMCVLSTSQVAPASPNAVFVCKFLHHTPLRVACFQAA
nr:MAG TPA: hypothetical protein [Caudoviricetes sp.]